MPQASIAGLRAFFFKNTATTEIYTLSLHDALPISSFFNPTIIFIAALAYLSAGFTPGGGWKTYRNQHLGFSLKFPGDLNAEEFPDGLMLVNDKLPGIDRNIIQVTNAAFSQPNSNDRGAEYFNLFRNARPGSVP